MPQFNFGQQINQNVSSAMDRIQRAQFKSLEIQQRMEERELQQQVQQAQQAFRQRQLNLQEDRIRADEVAQQRQQQNRNLQLGIQQKKAQVSAQRTRKLNQLTDAKINQLENATTGGGQQDFSNKRLVDLISEANEVVGRTQENVQGLKGQRTIAFQGTQTDLPLIGRVGGDEEDQAVSEIDSSITSQENRIERLNNLIDDASRQLQQNLIDGGGGPATGGPQQQGGQDTGTDQAQGFQIPDEWVQQFIDENPDMELTEQEAREILESQVQGNQ